MTNCEDSYGRRCDAIRCFKADVHDFFGSLQFTKKEKQYKTHTTLLVVKSQDSVKISIVQITLQNEYSYNVCA